MEHTTLYFDLVSRICVDKKYTYTVLETKSSNNVLQFLLLLLVLFTSNPATTQAASLLIMKTTP